MPIGTPLQLTQPEAASHIRPFTLLNKSPLDDTHMRRYIEAMAKPTEWADELIMMVRSAMLKLQIRTFSNLGADYDRAPVVPSEWEEAEGQEQWPVAQVGHLARRSAHGDGGAHGYHFVAILTKTGAVGGEAAASATPGSGRVSSPAAEPSASKRKYEGAGSSSVHGASHAAGTAAASTDPSSQFFPEDIDEDDGFGMGAEGTPSGDEDADDDEGGGGAVRLGSHRINSKCPPARAPEFKFNMNKAPWCFQFKCWFMADGMSEKECLRHQHKGTTFGAKMRFYLRKYPYIGVVPDGDVAPGFSPITLDTVDSDHTTHDSPMLRGLYGRVHGAFERDYIAMRRGKLLPMGSQPKERFAFFPEWISGWNQSRGWCSAEGCGKALELHVQTVPAHSRLHRYEDEPVDNSKDNAWSLQRELNHIAHVPSNIMGVICFQCQGVTNFNHLAHSNVPGARHPRLNAPRIEVDVTTPEQLMQSLIEDAKQRYLALGGPEAAAAELQAPPPSYNTKTKKEYCDENREREEAGLPPRWKMTHWRKTDGAPPEYTEASPRRSNGGRRRRQAAANATNENEERPRRSRASAKKARDDGSQETGDEPPPPKRRKRNAAKPVSPKEVTVEACAASLELPKVGDRVQVWHREDKWYLGSVLAIKCFVSKVFHKRALMHQIKYDFDQEEVWHDLRREYWRKPKNSRTANGPISLAQVVRDRGLTRAPLAADLNDGRSEGYLSSVDMSVSDAPGSEAESESDELESVDSDAVSAVSRGDSVD